GIDGTPIWSHAYGGPFFARGESVQPHPECGYTFTGFINGPFPSEFGFGAGEIYLVKTDDRGDSGCLQQELIAEPVGPTQCEYLPVQARPLVESQTLPNFLDFTDSSEEVFCFDDLCGAPPEPTPCNAADLAAPFELLNSSDINAFVAGYLASQPNADLAAPAGVWNSSDINAFVAAYLAGCP
ncbi:MAG: GC-type dockerin domain-anchored protein, partial [Planctomycetota bacterium]